MTAEPYQPATGPGDGPATDPDLVVVPDDVVEGEVLDGDAGAGEGAANDGAANDGAANDSAANDSAANDSAANELTGSSLGQDNASDDYPAATEPSLFGAAAEAGMAGTIDGENSSSAAGVTSGPVTTDSPAADLGQQWHDIQAMFVDDPRGSVEQAAAVADAAVSELAETLRRQRASLVGADGDPAGTEELREALRGYRIFCQAVADVSRQLRQPQP
jgi:hypothetical protein